jgi:hypothetical protein
LGEFWAGFDNIHYSSSPKNTYPFRLGWVDTHRVQIKLSSIINYSFLYIFFFISVLVFLFFSWHCCWSFFSFQFHPSIKFFVVLVFLIWLSFFWLVFPFIIAILQFNLTLQLKFFIHLIDIFFHPNCFYILSYNWLFFPDFIFWYLICWGFNFVRSYHFILVFFSIGFMIILICFLWVYHDLMI